MVLCAEGVGWREETALNVSVRATREPGCGDGVCVGPSAGTAPDTLSHTPNKMLNYVQALLPASSAQTAESLE